MAELQPKEVKIIRPTSEMAKSSVLRVAAYCRVSTDSDDQVNSFITQVKYYNDFIRLSDGMELVDIYADEHVIIGTSGENLVKSRGSALVPFSFLLRDKPKSFKSLKIINERL